MPSQNSIPQPTPVWPPALKVLVALGAGILLAFVAFVQYIPEELTADNAAASRNNQFFVAEDVDAQTQDDGGGTVAVGRTQSGGSEAATSAKAGSSGGIGANVGGGAAGPDGGQGGPDPSGGGALECKAGRNGGETDTGVTADKIKLAANVVLDGAGANFLSQSPDGIEAMANRVNIKEKGVCGRTLELNLVNDSWKAARGHTNIKNFIKEGYFALPVLPSSEGLSAAIDAETIKNAGIPVVGTDGMRKEQYQANGNAAWVWPVATATVSQVRIMADYAYDKLGARKFGIVYDQVYKFGVEGAEAYQCFIEGKGHSTCPGGYGEAGLAGASVEAVQAIAPLGNDYSGVASTFLEDCSDCDVVVLLLDPQTGKTWMSGMDDRPDGMVVMGAQPLFNDNFASQCTDTCNGVWVWTGYNPAIGANRSKEDIARFISDVEEKNPSADVTNQFLQGAYLGMEVFVHAVKECSPNLTRACVRSTMDSLTYETDMASPLTWKAGNHFANLGARGYTIAYDGPNFTGFRDEQTGFHPDPTPGVVPD